MRKVYYIYNPQTQTYDRIYPTLRQRMMGYMRRLFIGMGLGAVCFIAPLIIFGSPSEKELRKENSQLQLGLSAKESEMYSALSNGYKYYLKAVALDTLPNKKGKVKPKHLKNIRKDLLLNSDGYIQGGVYYFNQKEYKKAYDIWDIFLQIRDLPFMATEADKMPADSIYAMLEFNSALAAIQTGDHDMAIEALNRAKGNGYSQNDVYKYLVSEYEITDKIRITIAPNPVIDNVVKEYGEYISRQTLADSIAIGNVSGENVTELDLDTFKVNIHIEKA